MSNGIDTVAVAANSVEGPGNRCNTAWYKLLDGTVVQVQVKNIVQLLWVGSLLPTL